MVLTGQKEGCGCGCDDKDKVISLDCNDIVASADDIRIDTIGVKIPYDDITYKGIELKKNMVVGFTSKGMVIESDGNRNFAISDMRLRSISLLLSLSGTFSTVGENTDMTYQINVKDDDTTGIKNLIGSFDKTFEFAHSFLGVEDFFLSQILDINGVMLDVDFKVTSATTISVHAVEIKNTDQKSLVLATVGDPINNVSTITSESFNTYDTVKSLVFRFTEILSEYHITNYEDDDVEIKLMFST
jgi:hypothetical protein